MLHQHQGEITRIDHLGQVIDYIEVVPDDIACANRLTDELLGRSLNELAQQTRPLLRVLRDAPGHRKFNTHRRLGEYWQTLPKVVSLNIDARRVRHANAERQPDR